MKFGYSIPSNQGFEDVHELIALAKLAEEHGLDSVWASEHLFHTAYIAERLGNRPYYETLTIPVCQPEPRHCLSELTYISGC